MSSKFGKTWYMIDIVAANVQNVQGNYHHFEEVWHRYKKNNSATKDSVISSRDINISWLNIPQIENEWLYFIDLLQGEPFIVYSFVDFVNRASETLVLMSAFIIMFQISGPL